MLTALLSSGVILIHFTDSTPTNYSKYHPSVMFSFDSRPIQILLWAQVTPRPCCFSWITSAEFRYSLFQETLLHVSRGTRGALPGILSQVTLTHHGTHHCSDTCCPPPLTAVMNWERLEGRTLSVPAIAQDLGWWPPQSAYHKHTEQVNYRHRGRPW